MYNGNTSFIKSLGFSLNTAGDQIKFESNWLAIVVLPDFGLPNNIKNLGFFTLALTFSVGNTIIMNRY